MAHCILRSGYVVHSGVRSTVNCQIGACDVCTFGASDEGHQGRDLVYMPVAIDSRIRELRSSTVLRLLTAYERSVPISAVRPASRRAPARVRALMEHLEKSFALRTQFNPRPVPLNGK